ncbi:transposase-like protein [Clostridium tetanomorphum]|uniref:Uncharacterized protein n=1 Tax=Clostridium tetanomorphum TaxID=1553 RepID=A0A923J1Z1_CLOTT|nr:hypothetical protein [Clostridium tetanomorphum]MBC2399731.1 hypothetical protein [Clostridium tetanomorphum]MBP1865135.1 transposase-like protein [Clostridium tetanomorphum]NRS84726.1 transposase-like protein [Clostridium tetanomorphum]NRZ97942.1 transposase-like protein [Clostridium tetanomorphum]SQB91773.1 Uncharacterised protein [Clostridium tetanomorphum]
MDNKIKKTFDKKCPYCCSDDVKTTKLEVKTAKDITETEYVCSKCKKKFIFIDFI